MVGSSLLLATVWQLLAAASAWVSIFAAYMTSVARQSSPEDLAAHAVPGFRTGRGTGNSGPGSGLHQVTGSATS